MHRPSTCLLYCSLPPEGEKIVLLQITFLSAEPNDVPTCTSTKLSLKTVEVPNTNRRDTSHCALLSYAVQRVCVGVQ